MAESKTNFILTEFKEIFKGFDKAFGVHEYEEKLKKGKKDEGHSHTEKNKLITITNYKDHLEGKTGLGIIPLDKDLNVNYTIIDVDIYNMNFKPYIEAIYRHNFPMVPFFSKSGGLHIYVFFSEPAPAERAIKATKKLSSVLALDLLVKQQLNQIIEIFPKQTNRSKTNFGNWVNLPYFGALGKTTRKVSQAIGEDYQTLKLEEALTKIKNSRLTIDELEKFIKELKFKDAPPCLQAAYFLNQTFKGSGRNNLLFSFAVLFKKSDSEFFEQLIYEINDGFKDPLEKGEIHQTILSSISDSESYYLCTKEPCNQFCNKKECALREYGVNREGGFFSIVECRTLFQIKAKVPWYEWEVRIIGQDDWKKLRFKNEDDIILQNAFLRLCFRELHTLPAKLNQKAWFKKVNDSLSSIQIIEVNEEEDPTNTFHVYLHEFFLKRSTASHRGQILMGRVFYNKEEDVYMFRISDLITYLTVDKQFRELTKSEIHGELRDLGVTSKRTRLKVSAKSDAHFPYISYLPKRALTRDMVEMEKDAEVFEPEFPDVSHLIGNEDEKSPFE